MFFVLKFAANLKYLSLLELNWITKYSFVYKRFYLYLYSKEWNWRYLSLLPKVFYPENRWQMRREYSRIPPEMGKDSSMQHILVLDNLVVFWIFIHFQLRQSNHVQYRNLQVSNRVNLSACARRYIVAYHFLILPTFAWLFANCRYGKFADRGSCKQKKFWLALLNVNQSKKWAVDVP